MITVFDMVSGETETTIGEPARKVERVEPAPLSREVQLRLLTLDEAIAQERHSAR
ncbi:hypothetical protein [Chitinimonas sp. BJYL2]|uniref:hypothetical protein n=1 Tax=Chitinimonas sp. BJYL2 TaxID=2976696 RepID=UPI0022B302C1|nr:hypothetical protein [Chitinimonas sp. BJYL2]